MEKYRTSIFNDVIGPVMRGPSSSHAAASVRIGQMLKMAARNKIVKAAVDYDINGSLAETHDGQGSDMGLAAGFLGLEMTDPKMPGAVEIAKTSGLDFQINILDYGAVHPNNYRIKTFAADGNEHNWEAISTGGGMIRIWRFNGFEIDIMGDYHELLVISDCKNTNYSGGETACDARTEIEKLIPDFEYISESHGTGVAHNGQVCINIKTTSKIEDETINKITALAHVRELIQMYPVLPTLSKKGCTVPYSNAEELLQYTKDNKRNMWELAAYYESIRGNISENEVFEKMADIADIFINCVKEGLAGTSYKDRILGPEAHLIEKGIKEKTLLPSDLLNNIIKNITAIMEVKSSMGIIVAAPTAGSCGCLPGTILGIGETLNLSKEELVKALLASALVGVFIANKSGFAAEVAGCQVECGAGSAMAAAGTVQIMGGTVRQCIDAAAIALQNVSGLACDMVANRTEVPCLGKNIMCGVNAAAAATMAMAGFSNVIPLDETIEAISDIGKSLPASLRCTLGGLGKTGASQRIREKLETEFGSHCR